MNERTQYLEQYLDRCWEARQYYKDETSKILYFAGSVFLAIVGATGIFGANQNSKFLFTVQHMVIFHAAFLAAWFYYLYKQLNADMFEKLGRSIEKHIRQAKKLDLDWEFESFFGLKGHYLGKAVGHGRSLTKFANTILVLLYITVTGVPIFRGGISATSINVNWDFLFATGAFPILLFIAWCIYRKERARVLKALDQDWREYLRFEQKSGNLNPVHGPSPEEAFIKKI